jgi:hypothetical protein
MTYLPLTTGAPWRPCISWSSHERYVKGPFDVWFWETLHISLEGCGLIAVAAAYLLEHCFYPNQLHLRQGLQSDLLLDGQL